MLQSLLPLLAFFAAVVVAGVAISRWARRKSQQQRDLMRAGSTARGWSCEWQIDGAHDLTRWEGKTDGVPWTAEYRRLRHKRKGQTRAHNLRWWADGFGVPNAPVLLMGVPKGKEIPAVTLAQGDGLLASLAQKAAGFAFDKSLDLFFGAEVGQQIDARTLRAVESVVLPGLMVMAADNTAGAFWLNQTGHRSAIETLLRDPSSALSDDVDRPWVLLMGAQVRLARMAPVTKVEDLERLVRAGVALVRASQ
jgi:hypothetical protein